MKKIVITSAILAVLVFIWYLAADRVTPYSSNVRVKAMVIEIVPEVSGKIVAVPVNNGQIVEAGELLARIEQQPFILKVEQAKADLELAIQELGVGSSVVEIAIANLASARTNLNNVKVQTDRIFELEKKGVVAIAKVDDARTTLDKSKSAVLAAEADLERARRDLGVDGIDNPKIKQASAALSEAQLALEWTNIRAPARGVIVDLDVTSGVYAREGGTLLNFVSFEEVWVEAYMKENNIANINIGNPAEISLDLYPGRIFDGVVASISYGSSDGTDSSSLPSIPSSDGWMRDPQRFAVRISMTNYQNGNVNHDLRRMVNGQADVIVYTGEQGVMNMLGVFWIRLMSIISYAY